MAAASSIAIVGRASPRECLLMSNISYSDNLSAYLPVANEEGSAGIRRSKDSDEDVAQYLKDGAELAAKGWSVVKQILPGQYPESGGYSGTIFINPSRGQIVLAHRGTQNFGSKLADMHGVVFGEETSQEHAAVRLTQEAVAVAKEHTYHLTQTGHSLGGWLAQISYLHNQGEGSGEIAVQYDDANALTFDNPGPAFALGRLKLNKNIDTADSISLLSWPNAINTCGEQIGTVYFLTPEILEKSNNFLIYYFYSFFSAHPLKTIRNVFENVGTVAGAGSAALPLKEYPRLEDCHLMISWPEADRGEALRAFNSITTPLGFVAAVASIPSALWEIGRNLFSSLFDSKRLTASTEGPELRCVFKVIDPRHKESVENLKSLDFNTIYRLQHSGHLKINAKQAYTSLLSKHMHHKLANFLQMYYANTGLDLKLGLKDELIALLAQCSFDADKKILTATNPTANIFEICAKLENFVLLEKLDDKLRTTIAATASKVLSMEEELKKKETEVSARINQLQATLALVVDDDILRKGLNDKIATFDKELAAIKAQLAEIVKKPVVELSLFAIGGATARAGGTATSVDFGGMPIGEILQLLEATKDRKGPVSLGGSSADGVGSRAHAITIRDGFWKNFNLAQQDRLIESGQANRRAGPFSGAALEAAGGAGAASDELKKS